MTSIYVTERGDAVKCSNCANVMLVKLGSEECPRCKSIGTLMWLDDNKQEMTVKEFKDYVVLNKK